MPTVLRSGPYRFYFWSHELSEPPHIHVDRERYSVKFWLDPVALSSNLGFKPHELKQLPKLIENHHKKLMEAWHGHFGVGS